MSVAKMLTVLEEKPWVYALSSSAAKNYCHFCFNKITNRIKCPDCRFTRYCSTNCSEKAAREHKSECQLLRMAKGRIPNEKTRLMSRILIKLVDLPPPETQKVERSAFSKEAKMRLPHGLTLTYKILTIAAIMILSYVSDKEIISDYERMVEFFEIRRALQVYMAKWTLPEAGELFEIYCRVLTVTLLRERCLTCLFQMILNIFNITSSTLLSVGIGIYLTMSQLKHSCSPNSVIVYNGLTAHLNLLGPTDENAKVELGKICIGYLPLIGNRDERRRALKKRYYFFCQCTRCMNDEQSSLETDCTCPAGSCKGHKFAVANCDDAKCEMNNETATVQCPADLMIRTPDDFAQIKQGVQAGDAIVPLTAALISRLNQMYVAAKEFLEKHEKILISTHVQLIRTESIMAKAAYFKGSYIEATSLYENIIWRLEKYMPENLPLLSLAEMAVSRLCLMTGDLVRTKQHLLNACDLTRRCYGRQHPTHNMVLRFLDDCEQKLVKKGIDPYGIECQPSQVKSITTLQQEKPKGNASQDKEEKQEKEQNKKC
ncbi:MYND finger [Trichuris suis]|nr:MYND finger [Trichuris suis]